MNENEIYPEDAPDAIDLTDSADDVEGHGLKEVAAGLGAAAVLAGGAAGATHLAGSSLSVHPSSNSPGISVTVDDPLATANHLTDNAIAGAQHQRDAAENLAINQVGKTDQRIADVKADALGAVKGAAALADATTSWAGDVTKASTKLATTEVKAADTLAMKQATHATSTATTVADKQVSNTATTAGSTVRDVDRKVATILSVVTTTAADGVHTAKITLNAVDAGAGANTSSAGGWVLVKAGDTVLAQVQMHGGTATASWTMPLTGGHTISISYTGDNVFAPSARAMAL
jgi:hypothetical protein